MTGMPLAIDGPDADTNVDQLALPASVVVTAADVPSGSTLVRAFLFWGGTQDEGGGADLSVTLTYPNGGPTPVTADVWHGSDGAAGSYDMFLCRAEITSILAGAGGALTGTYSLDDYSGLVANGSAHNASAAVVLVFGGAGFPYRTIVVEDGLATVNNSSYVATSSGFSAAAPNAELTFYTMEGDTGGTGLEQVSVKGLPSLGSPVILSDAVNPSTNPMNHTINTTSPAQTDVIGVDIDRFAIGGSLAPGDTHVETTYSAGSDKWWLGVQVLSVESSDPCAPPSNYCTAGTSASGCLALLSSTGTPSATATSGFAVVASGVEGAKDGLFFFGANGRQANPWGNGSSYQCVVPPVRRAGLLAGSGTTGQCDGLFSQDLNALWCPTCPKPQKNFGAGAVVQVQLWYRDPFNTSNQTTSMSDAIEFCMGP